MTPDPAVVEPDGSPPADGPGFWHPNIHEDLLDEELFYFRLTFGPTYHRDQIVTLVEAALADEGITSYAAFEVNGGYDLILRCWLPNSVKKRRIRDAINAKVLPSWRLIYIDEFQVTKTLRHWVWKPDGKPPEIKDYLDQACQSPDAAIDALTNTPLNTLPVGVRAIPESMSAQRFFVLVTAELPEDPEVHVRVSSSLEKITDDAATVLDDVSLYEGKGIASFLIKGSLRPDQTTEDISTHVLDHVNELNLPANVYVRTFTYLTLRNGTLAFQEGLRRNDRSTRRQGQATEVASAEPSRSHVLLLQGESQTVEVKGSLFLNIDALFHNEDERISHEDRIFDHGIVRTLVGFLNGSEEADLIVGALESEDLRHSIHPAVNEFFQATPVVGRFRCIGIGPDALPKERKLDALLDTTEPDFDTLQRRIGSLLQKRVQPAPNRYVSITVEPVLDRQLLRFHVSPPRREPPFGYPWFYSAVEGQDRPKRFYVRNLTQTVEKSGVELDDYRGSLISHSLSQE